MKPSLPTNLDGRYRRRDKRMRQSFYEEEADLLFPKGCECRDGSCAWCFIYYNGLDEGDRNIVDAIMQFRETPR